MQADKPSNKRISSRRVVPSSDPAGESCPPTKELPHTTSTSASSKSSSISRSDSRPEDLDRKRCPVTGVLRDIHSEYHVFSTVLGKGHYGSVRECEHLKTGKLLAVKSVEKAKIRRLDHLQREVYLLCKMNHLSIMRMVDCYEDEDSVHIVTERYTGGELFDKISDNSTAKGCLSEKRAAGIIKSLLEAVAYLHKNGVVHRDIKPENILFENTREDSAIKLIDFGLSRRHKKGDALMKNPVGTAYYMSPEVLDGKYDASCDVWSVGTIAYILLAGYPPFNGEDDSDIFDRIREGTFDFPREVWSSKSSESKDFIKCLLKMNPDDRYSAKEALRHSWIRKNGGSDSSVDRAREHEDITAKIKMLRMTVSKFKKSMKEQ